MSRIFIALTPKPDFNKVILNLKSEQNKLLDKKAKVNWSQNDQHHITLNFIGSMEPEQKEEMFKLIDKKKYSVNIPIEISGLSYFPNDNGQVLVANISLNPKLQKLYREVEEIVARIGFGMSLKSFKPHITLARFKQKNKPFSELIVLEKPLTSTMDSLDVYESSFDSGKTLHSLIKSYAFE